MARGDILLISLPDSDRREEKGNRPAIVVQVEIAASPMLMIVPVTSSLGAMRFPFVVKIEPSELNSLTMPSVAMVFQVRAIDKKRIVRKIGELDPEYLHQVDLEIWRMLKPSEVIENQE